MRRRGRRSGAGKTLGLLALLGVAGIAGVCLGRAWLIPSSQIEEEPAPAYDPPASVVDRLAGAIRFPTISNADPALTDEVAFEGLRAYLVRAFPRAHVTLKREVVNGSLLYSWIGTNDDLPPALLMGHLDVVPVAAGTENDWVHPPFAGVFDGTHIWGRGSMDDKVTVLGVMEAVEALLVEGFRPARTFYLAFGHDEEVGGARGAVEIARILQGRGVRLGFLLDEGPGLLAGTEPDIGAPLAQIGISEKGYLTVELVARGETGHASCPPAHTAVGRIARAITRIEDNPAPLHLPAAERARLTALASQLPFWRRAVYANLWLTEPFLLWWEAREGAAAPYRTTRAATMIQGGVKDNVLPSEARATVNIRLRPGQTSHEAIEVLAGIIDDPEIAIKTVIASEPSATVPMESRGYQVLHRSIREVFPDVVVVPKLVTGATDSRHYAAVSEASFRFMPMSITPADFGRYHGTNERLAAENYKEIIRFYRRLIMNLNGDWTLGAR